MKKKVISTLTAMAVCAAMAVPVMAGAPTTPAAKNEVVPVPDGTDVYAGVTLDKENEDPQIRVTVPTTFAFVVNGTTDGTKKVQAVTAANNALLLPNVKVKVEANTTGNGDYSVNAEGSAVMNFQNYSSCKDTAGSGRKGAEIKLSAYIEDEGTEADRNYWNHVATVPGTNDADFKNYRISVDGKKFDKEDGNRDYISAPVTLTAPTGTIDTDTKLALAPSQTALDFDVEVGGNRGMYSQVEESAKVGTITWVASYTYTNDGTVPTAPSNDPLEEPTP